MSRTKIDLIIQAFQNMDLDMLADLLNESNTYQNAPKSIFIHKLNEVFSILKRNGDHQLLAVRGICRSSSCPNKGCTGYSFRGLTSKKQIDLIFEEQEDDVNDIRSCARLRPIDKAYKIGNTLTIAIKIDEEADFVPTEEYLFWNLQFEAAYNELFEYKNQRIDQTIYIPWLEKHRALCSLSTSRPPMFFSKYHKFYSLYQRFNDLKSYLDKNDLAKTALVEFAEINPDDEVALLKWLVKYEITGNELINFGTYAPIECDCTSTILHDEIRSLKILDSEFEFVSKFKNLFDKYYWKLFEKYQSSCDPKGEKVDVTSSDPILGYTTLAYLLANQKKPL